MTGRGSGLRTPVTVSVLLLSAGSSPTLGQDRQYEKQAAWLSLGAGFGSGGFATRAAVTYQYRVLAVSARASSMFFTDSDSFREVGATVGVATPPYVAHVSLAVGLGQAIVERRAPLFPNPNVTYPCAYAACTRVGILSEARFAVRAKGVGFGLAAFGNLNSIENFGGIVLDISLGQHW